MPRDAATIEIPNNWRTRPYQDALWNYLINGGRRAIPLWHRRSGKDEVCLHWTAVAAMQRPGSYWHMLPEAAQARKAVWDAINPHTGKRRIDEAFPQAIRRTTREHDMMIPFLSGSTWQVVGSDNFNSLVGSPPVGVVFSEWALADPRAWAYLRPILAENGGWAIFISSVRGRNHAWAMYEAARNDPAWFAQILTVDDTGVIPKDVLDTELREYQRELGEDAGRHLFMQEYYCSPDAAILGAYYGKEMAAASARITTVEHRRGIPVDVWFDLGARRAGGTMAVGFVQRVGQEIHCIDFLEDKGNQHGLPWVAKEMQARQTSEGYVYGDIVWPHDGGHMQKATGETLAVTFRKLTNFHPIVLDVDAVGPGIDLVRNSLSRFWWDAKKCEQWVEALRNYRADWDEDRKIFKPTPRADWSSHAADMTRYGCMHSPSGDWGKKLEYKPMGVV